MKKESAPWTPFVNVIAKDLCRAASLRRTCCRKCVQRKLVCIVHSFLFFVGRDKFPNTAFLTNESFLMFVPFFVSALRTKATPGWSRILSAYPLYKSNTHRHLRTRALLKCLRFSEQEKQKQRNLNWVLNYELPFEHPEKKSREEGRGDKGL
jgi:hypothetical protein